MKRHPGQGQVLARYRSGCAGKQSDPERGLRSFTFRRSSRAPTCPMGSCSSHVLRPAGRFGSGTTEGLTSVIASESPLSHLQCVGRVNAEVGGFESTAARVRSDFCRLTPRDGREPPSDDQKSAASPSSRATGPLCSPYTLRKYGASGRHLIYARSDRLDTAATAHTPHQALRTREAFLPTRMSVLQWPALRESWQPLPGAVSGSR